MTRIRFSPWKVMRTILSIVVGLTIVHVSLKAYRFFNPSWDDSASLWRLFNTSGYGNIPRYFRALLLLSSSALFATIACAKRQMSDRLSKHWAALAYLFLYLSIDDAASIHQLGNRVNMSWLLKLGVQSYAWAYIGVVFCALFGIVFYRFVFNLPVETRRLFIASGALYVLGACGMEITKSIVVQYSPPPSIATGIVKTLKQTFEMLGNSLLIYAQLSYIGKYIGLIGIELGGVHESVRTEPRQLSGKEEREAA